MARGSGWRLLLILMALACGFSTLPADEMHCSLCGALHGKTIYTRMDKVTHQRQEMCHTCAVCPDTCYICSLPVPKNLTRLVDGRVLCARDIKSAVLDKSEALQICTEVRDALNRTFSRFMAFPETNVDVRIMDRIDLLSFKVPGNDFECPNLLGYISPVTVGKEVRYPMRLMSGLTRAEFKSTCAHEYTHAWVFRTVPHERRLTLGHDAHEGFCELIAYMLAESQHDSEAMELILANGYTRGQIDLFVEAASRYGLNDVVDWMKYGEDSDLIPGEIARIRNVEMPSRRLVAKALPLVAAVAQDGPTTLQLGSISSGSAHPFALINGATLSVGEMGKARLGNSNVLIRCLAIAENSVRVRIESSGEEKELRFKSSR